MKYLNLIILLLFLLACQDKKKKKSDDWYPNGKEKRYDFRKTWSLHGSRPIQ